MVGDNDRTSPHHCSARDAEASLEMVFCFRVFFWWAPPNTAPFFYDAGLETPGDSLNNRLFTITVFSFVWALSAGGTVVIVMWICCTKAM
jgi:hypothetical protein